MEPKNKRACHMAAWNISKAAAEVSSAYARDNAADVLTAERALREAITAAHKQGVGSSHADGINGERGDA